MEQSQPYQPHLREWNADVCAVGADAIGHDGGLLALDPGQHRSEHQQHGHRVADVQDVDDEILDHARLDFGNCQRREQCFSVSDGWSSS